MTIAAGFVCTDGLVLCADTQETVWETFKVRVPKLTVRELSDRKLIIAGAGDGPFIDKIVDLCWQAALSADATIDAVSDAVETTIADTYQRFKNLFYESEMPSAKLIFGVWVKNQKPRLYTSYGPIVNCVQKTALVGTGRVLAQHITDRMFASHFAVLETRMLAAYMLSHVKEYVDGCGGDSEIVVLQSDGRLDRMRSSLTHSLASSLRWAEWYFPKLLLSTGMGYSQRQFNQILREFCVHARETKTRWDETSGIYGDSVYLNPQKPKKPQRRTKTGDKSRKK